MTDKDSPRSTVGRVLLVEDASTLGRQLGQALEEAGLEVAVAREGLEALWRARATQFDLVLTDVHMPTMDGLQFLSELRELPQYSTTPVYVLTADASKERLARGRELGATAWIVKPPNIPVLVLSIRNAVIAQRLAAGVPAPRPVPNREPGSAD
jgi:two-component system, chemotaxis family, chemotaxis protein CheY